MHARRKGRLARLHDLANSDNRSNWRKTMALTIRPLAAALFLIFFSALLLDRAQAGSGHYYPR